MSSFKSNENIHKKEDGSYYVVSANKASSVTLNLILVFDESVVFTYLYRNKLLQTHAEILDFVLKRNFIFQGPRGMYAYLFIATTQYI